MATTQKELLQVVLDELSSIKRDLPNGQFKQLVETVRDMKEDMSELKYTLLNPEDGVIVKTNKSLETSQELERRIQVFSNKLEEINDVVRWKNTVTKVLWILFTAIVGLIVKVLSMGDGIL